jgi:integrase
VVLRIAWVAVVDIDLAKAELHVRQRADRYCKIGRPKSESSERTIPIPTQLLNALKEWKLRGRSSPGLDLVFQWCWPRRSPSQHPRQLASDTSCCRYRRRERQGRYSGLHCLRHFYASWCINRKGDGGLELRGKVVQERLAHSTIGTTMDVYGHLFPRHDDQDELAAAAAPFFVIDSTRA